MNLRRAARSWTAPVLWRFCLSGRGRSKAPEDWRSPRRSRADAGSRPRCAAMRPWTISVGRRALAGERLRGAEVRNNRRFAPARSVVGQCIAAGYAGKPAAIQLLTRRALSDSDRSSLPDEFGETAVRASVPTPGTLTMNLRRAARFWTAPVLWRFSLRGRARSKAPEDWRSPRRSRAGGGSWPQSEVEGSWRLPTSLVAEVSRRILSVPRETKSAPTDGGGYSSRMRAALAGTLPFSPSHQPSPRAQAVPPDAHWASRTERFKVDHRDRESEDWRSNATCTQNLTRSTL